MQPSLTTNVINSILVFKPEHSKGVLVGCQKNRTRLAEPERILSAFDNQTTDLLGYELLKSFSALSNCQASLGLMSSKSASVNIA